MKGHALYMWGINRANSLGTETVKLFFFPITLQSNLPLLSVTFYLGRLLFTAHLSVPVAATL